MCRLTIRCRAHHRPFHSILSHCPLSRHETPRHHHRKTDIRSVMFYSINSSLFANHLEVGTFPFCFLLGMGSIMSAAVMYAKLELEVAEKTQKFRTRNFKDSEEISTLRPTLECEVSPLFLGSILLARFNFSLAVSDFLSFLLFSSTLA